MLGIDLGSRYLKAVALNRRRGRWHLQACLARLIDPQQSGAALTVLREILPLLPAEVLGRRQHIAIALPCGGLLIRNLPLPASLSHQQTELAIRMEFEPALANATDPLCLDYRRVGEQVLAVACPQAFMDKALDPLEAAGLRPTLVCADGLVVADSIMAASVSGDSVLYVDAGATGVRLYAMRDGIPVYHRSHSLDDSPASHQSAAYLLLLRRAIQQYRLSDMLSKPAALLLYGGASGMAGVQDALQQAFGLPVSCIDPFVRFDVCDASQIGAGSDLPASAFTLACVLAAQDASCA